MKKRTRSILEELSSLETHRDSDYLIEASANNIIESAINLMNKINRVYEPQLASELERRFINSIKAGDPKKFRRGIDKARDSKNDS